MSDLSTRPLRKGEYDLVNISLIGHDPVSGRSYDECSKEWRQAAEAVEAEAAQLHWWNIAKHLRIRWRTAVLYQRLGAPPGFFGFSPAPETRDDTRDGGV